MSDRERLRIGISGIGTVGGAVAKLLGDAERRAEYERYCGCALQITRVAARSPRDAAALRDLGLAADVDYGTDSMALAEADDVDVLLELVGGVDEAKRLASAALKSGKHLITANKALLAECGDELFALARDNGRELLWEAAVAGGIPIVRALRHSLAATRPLRISGILNGTSNFIVSDMARSAESDYAQALKRAQELGYAEADPSADVEGNDAAAKLLLLAHLAWGAPLAGFAWISRQGIVDLKTVDFRKAGEWGYAIRPIAVAERDGDSVSFGVYPALAPSDVALASVDGVDNAIEVVTDLGVMTFRGPGAGGEATASAVLADLLQLAAGVRTPPPPPAVAHRLVAANARARHYLRFELKNEPGALETITKVLGARDINIELISQDRPESSTSPVQLLVGVVETSRIRAALEEIAKLPSVSRTLCLQVMPRDSIDR